MPADLVQLFEEHGFKCVSKNTNESASPCPACGGTDRCVVKRAQPDHPERAGYFWCRQCGAKGDGVEFLRTYCGYSYKEACERAQVTAVPYLKTPRLATMQKSNTFRAVDDAEKQNTDMLDPEAWQQKARALVAWATENLINNPEKMAYLARRGIDAWAVRRYRLGYNPGEKGKDCIYRARSAWGIPNGMNKKTGKPTTKLWIPRGIVVPYITTNGDDWRVERIRIRRNDDDLGEKDAKYIVLSGSPSKDMMWLECTAKAHTAGGVVVVTEAELDAIALHAAAGDLCHCVGAETCKVSSISHTTNGKLEKAACILVALDQDDAGYKGTQSWTATFPRARRWVCPGAKDPGDAFAAGLDLRLWLEAGIPDGLRMATPTCPCPVENRGEKEGGGKEETGPAPEGSAQDGARPEDLPPEMEPREPYVEEYKGVYGTIRFEDGRWIPPEGLRELYELWRGTPVVYRRKKDEAGNVTACGFLAHPKWLGTKAGSEKYQKIINLVWEKPIIWDWLSLHLSNEITASNLFRLR